jgi:hypothetical protein
MPSGDPVALRLRPYLVKLRRGGYSADLIDN